MERIRKGDTVAVTRGKYRGRNGQVTKGRVIEILTGSDRVRLEGVGSIKRHWAPNKNPKVPQGGIVEQSMTIHVSNVMPLDPSTGKPTRVSVKKLDDGRKVRVARRSGEQLA